MRRGLALGALFLLIAGLELATQGLSLVLARLGAGMGALFSGTAFHVSPFRFVVGLGAIVGGLALGGLLAWSMTRRQEVAAAGSICPQCGNRTRRVKRKEWQRLLSTLMGERLTRRRCETCGWTGLSLTQ